MKIAYFDCFSGVSGDMVLGALVDAGLEPARLEAALGALGIEGLGLAFHKEKRGYLAGTRAEVTVEEGPRDRHLPEILEMIQRSSLNDRVKEGACSVFKRLAEAEAGVHGIPSEKVHFHEVGALDAIVDIVGAVAGLDLLGVERVFSSSLPLGTGQVRCRHGLLPLPAPAVVQLVADFEVRFTRIERELTTPTGAALITTLARSAGAPPSMVMERAGYGFGSHPGGDPPNALRVILGESAGAGLEEVVLLETNLDDTTGEVVGYLLERCLEEGALDAFTTPIQMKKSRPGLIFSVLAGRERVDRILGLIHTESGSLGVRVRSVHRSVLPRESFYAQTALGRVKVKKAAVKGWPVSLSPEYEDVARIAREKGLPLRLVYEKILAELHQRGAGEAKQGPDPDGPAASSPNA